MFFPPSSSEIFIATPVAGKSRKVNRRVRLVQIPGGYAVRILALKVRALLPSLWRVIVSISARASAEEKACEVSGHFDGKHIIAAAVAVNDGIRHQGRCTLAIRDFTNKVVISIRAGIFQLACFQRNVIVFRWTGGAPTD